MNVLLDHFNTPFETVPFDKISTSDFLPAIKEGIKQGKAEIENITETLDAPSFQNTIEALENSGELVNKVSTIFFNLNSAETNDEIQKLAQECSKS